MMMRPRKYGTLNRSIARATGYAINQYYRQNNKKGAYRTSNTQTATSDAGIVFGIMGFLFVVLVLFCAAVS